jgi:hypothetical protein
VQGSTPKFLEILKVLTRHRVEFIIVGGVSAVLHRSGGFGGEQIETLVGNSIVTDGFPLQESAIL